MKYIYRAGIGAAFVAISGILLYLSFYFTKLGYIEAGRVTTYVIDGVVSLVIASITIRKAYRWRYTKPERAHKMQVIETGGLVFAAMYLLLFGTFGGTLFVLLMALLLWNEQEVGRELIELTPAALAAKRKAEDDLVIRIAARLEEARRVEDAKLAILKEVGNDVPLAVVDEPRSDGAS